MSAVQQQQPFRRPVSPVEWWIAAHPRGMTPVLHVVVEGTGPLAAERLTEAVVAASDSVPGTRLTRRGRYWVDTGRPPGVREIPVAAGAAVTDLAELRRPLTDRHGPTCEVLLVTGPSTTSVVPQPATTSVVPQPATTSVVFRASHAVMDAHGVLFWAAEVFRALRGEPLLGARDTATETDVLPPLEPGTTPEPPALDCPPLLGAHVPGRERSTFWRRRTVDGYHPGLVARLATLIAAEVDAGQARFAVPVDLRRHAPDIRSTASLSHSVPLAVPSGQPWETTHQQLLTQLADGADSRARLSPAVLRVPMPLLRIMNARLQSQAATNGRYAADASLAHLGRVELADYSTDHGPHVPSGGAAFQARSLYSLSMSPVGGPVEFDLVESGGHTEITVTWHDGPGIAERAEQLLDRIAEQLSPAAHRHWTGNDTAAPRPDDGDTVVRRFAAQVAATPDAIAVSGPQGDLSYAELDRRSRAVAQALAARGIGRDDVVGVLADRSAAAVTAIWGILRAGAAYLPLDAQHPDARIAGLLDDAGSTVCLVERPHDTRSAVPDGCAALVLDNLSLDNPSPDNLSPDDVGPTPEGDWRDVEPQPGDLVYVMYTSGSTGRPKGVEIEHGSLLNYVDWATPFIGVDGDTRIPLLTSLSFDVSVTSIFLPLLVGGTLLLPSGPLDHTTLRELLLTSNATVLSMTPSLLELICELDVEPRGVRAVVAAGEVLRRTVADRVLTMFGEDCALLNLYGPTECTIEVTAHRYDPAVDAASGIPIGAPTENCTVHLLDGHGRFTAPGELGELHIGGLQLARGYRGRPDLTRDRFVHLADGTRVYRTGDVGRVLPSGAIEYVGRADDQVKVLGNRIEPAEIASALEEHPTVTRAAVVVRAVEGHAVKGRSRAGGGHKALCAYVQGDGIDTEVLAGHLAERLPRSMIPAAITVVSGFPQTVNGKIDVRGLPDPFADPAAEPAVTPVRDEIGAAVAAVWADVLGIDPERLGEDSDFHQLGGNSLLMLSMIAAVCREVLDPSVEPQFMARLGDIIRDPTIARVAEIAREAHIGREGQISQDGQISRQGQISREDRPARDTGTTREVSDDGSTVPA
ncbi:non-ribosomal peptide synthetase [Streptacidiphilus sp. EB129]|uniref:non-ribosomal peptide synthetase n=1 Tax=Streptacidiphilus sp. EB129 TaxID=3156262 RepID=UPI003517BB08